MFVGSSSVSVVGFPGLPGLRAFHIGRSASFDGLAKSEAARMSLGDMGDSAKDRSV